MEFLLTVVPKILNKLKEVKSRLKVNRPWPQGRSGAHKKMTAARGAPLFIPELSRFNPLALRLTDFRFKVLPVRPSTRRRNTLSVAFRFWKSPVYVLWEQRARLAIESVRL